MGTVQQQKTSTGGVSKQEPEALVSLLPFATYRQIYLPLPSHYVTIAATFTAEPLSGPLRGWMDLLGYDLKVRFAPFNQLFQQLLDPNSQLASGDNAAAVLLVRLADWQGATSEPGFQRHAEEFISALDAYLEKSAVPVILILCPSASPASTSPLDDSIAKALNRTESWLAAQIDQRPNVHWIDHQLIATLYPLEQIEDGVALRVAHIPYLPDYFVALGSIISRRLHLLMRPPVKVLVMDCDNTLWDGVCGESAPDQMQVSVERTYLQQRLLQLRASGMLICLCSKNHEDDVWAVFDQNANMLLKRSDITACRINWQNKSTNLKSLASELNLGLDSFVFVDDNPVECAEVREQCPQVLVLELPHQGCQSYVDHAWVLDQPKAGKEDRLRAEYYQAQSKRQTIRQSVKTLKEFLAGLELQVDIAPAQEDDWERIAQLTQRTNQLNFTTLRRTASEIRTLLGDGRHRCWSVRAQDKFGDYGLVGTLIVQTQATCWQVDTFLLSCRALGRRIEIQMLDHLIAQAQEYGVDHLEIRFTPTAKNEPARNLFQEFSSGNYHVVPDESQAPMWIARHCLSQWRSNIHHVASLECGLSSPNSNSVHISTSLARIPAYTSEMIDGIARLAGDVQAIVRLITPAALPRPEIGEPFVAPQSPLEIQIAEICRCVLNLERLGLEDPLKSMGITSLGVVQVLSRIRQETGTELSITELFTLPTVSAICRRIQDGSCGARLDQPSAISRNRSDSLYSKDHSHKIAVIGLAGRFPGAPDIDTFWSNLTQGVCSITDIPDQQLNLPLDSPLRSHPNLVKRAASMADADLFDAKFFGIFPKEAQVMDPQHRILIECCWHALEDAGYNPDAISVPVGLFAGCYMDTYVLASLLSNPALIHSLANSFHGGDLHCELGNDKDYLATRVSYLLNLRGPAMTVQTACSTSLVAIAQACQSLVSGQCDMALAGGVTLKLPQNRGYLYADGGMVSPDGTVRTFDAKARGTVFGEGAGVVALKRLDDALADGDDVYAVISGWGLNNDGRAKMGYTAPSVEGQCGAILAAHTMANISADSINYVEAHGTGTALGDPIEIDSLTRAFRRTTDKKQFCAIGSLKTNIGHLDVAAGVAGLIKVCLAMRHQLLPASLNFETPNPNIDFPETPFFVNTQLTPWTPEGQTRRAGLSSFGVGGTNAHVVIDQPPEVTVLPARRPVSLLVLSARSPSALQTLAHRLAEQLQSSPALDLQDVAYTLQTGRKRLNYSLTVLAKQPEMAIEQLRSCSVESAAVKHQVRRDTACIWMFPGQGSQYPNMGRQLYESEPVFTAALDRCALILQPLVGYDLRKKLFVDDDPLSIETCQRELRNTQLAQPAIFSIAYAYAQWLLACGVRPQSMLGHSVGEFVAACIGGVFSLPDALKMVAFRAQQMQALPSGDMLAVRSPVATVTQISQECSLSSQLAVAAVNSPQLCVISGPKDVVIALQSRLEADSIGCMPLHTSHAFHSAMMEPVIEPFAKELQQIQLRPSSIPIISTVTGKPLSDSNACDPIYWARHLRETVLFSDAAQQALQFAPAVFLEVGPGQTLSTLVRQHPDCNSQHEVMAVSPHAKQSSESIAEQLWATVGKLWQSGVNVRFAGVYDQEQRRRVHLPVYPFERQRYWFDQMTGNSASSLTSSCSSDFTQPDPQSSVTAVQTNPAPEGSMQQRAPAALASSYLPVEATDLELEDESLQRLIQQQLTIMEQQLNCWLDR
jgi:FkbH-like protein